jgi:hypothetical protein
MMRGLEFVKWIVTLSSIANLVHRANCSDYHCDTSVDLFDCVLQLHCSCVQIRAVSKNSSSLYTTCQHITWEHFNQA